MNRSYTLAALVILALGVIQPVMAHGGGDTTLQLEEFLLAFVGITLVVAAFLYWLYSTQSQPGTLPIKKLAIAAAATLVVNASVLGILYVEL
jgi:hypothetical protein